MSKRRVKVTVCGHFAFGKDLLNGQTVKTKILTKEIEKVVSKKEVYKIDTHGGMKKLFNVIKEILSATKNSENILILPAQNGLRVIAPALVFGNYKHNARLHYVVIGGWLPSYIKDKPFLIWCLKRIDHIYVETNSMKVALENQRFTNVCVMYNFKNLNIVKEEELIYPESEPYKLCTFSRVMKEKGIETAINVINRVNEKLGYIAYSLDIYGQVDDSQTEWFENLKKQFLDSVRYCGSVDADKSVEVLQQYFALIFPTHFYTEGIPGTIIDAYAAGIPVISAKWESYSDAVEEGITGLGYDFDSTEQFEEILIRVAKNPKILLGMKENCIHKAKNYIPDSTIQIIISNI